jgi:hypothetical protein
VTPSESELLTFLGDGPRTPREIIGAFLEPQDDPAELDRVIRAHLTRLRRRGKLSQVGGAMNTSIFAVVGEKPEEKRPGIEVMTQDGMVCITEDVTVHTCTPAQARALAAELAKAAIAAEREGSR